MKTLYLMRHAKADWTDEKQDDFDRPLTNRGERAASLMGVYMTQKGLAPRGILCSTAVRTQQTAARVMAQLPTPPECVDLPDLYMASANTILERVTGLADAPSPMLVIGHNPSMADFIPLALDRDVLKNEAAQQAMLKFPTAGLAIINFDCETWADIKPHSGQLQRFIVPKRLV